MDEPSMMKKEPKYRLDFFLFDFCKKTRAIVTRNNAMKSSKLL